jgi:hypothetical protein
MPQPNRYQGFHPIGGVSAAPAADAPAGDATVAPAATPGNATAAAASAAVSFETIRTHPCNPAVRTMTRLAFAL